MQHLHGRGTSPGVALNVHVINYYGIGRAWINTNKKHILTCCNSAGLSVRLAASSKRKRTFS